MSLIFCDSFDHYTTIAGANGKYDSPGNNCAIVGGGVARTGTQCLQVISAASGPRKGIRQVTDIVIAGSYYCSALSGFIYLLGNDGAGNGNSALNMLLLNGDGSLSVWGHLVGPNYGTTAPGIFHPNSYNALALRVTNIGASNSRIRVWCNGVLVLDLSPVNTGNGGPAYCNVFGLYGNGGNATTCYHDDLYVLDCTDAVNNQYLGPLRIYAGVPVSNGVVQWTPSVGTNWSNVNAIPPTGAQLNSSVTVGQVDQYLHPLPGAVPGNSTLFAIQHCQDLQTIGGSRSVTSDIAGVQNANPVALSSGFLIYPWPYDVDPATGLAWNAANFPLLAGPAVTA